MFGNTGVFGLSKISIPDESDVTQEHDKGKRLGLYKYREEEKKERSDLKHFRLLFPSSIEFIDYVIRKCLTRPDACR